MGDPTGQLPDALEPPRLVELLLQRAFPLALRAFADVADGRDSDDPAVGLEAREADLGGKLAAVLAAARELAAGPHRARLRVAEVRAAMRRVPADEPLRHELFHLRADELVAVVAEQRLGLAVHQGDATVRLDADDRVGCEVQQSFERALRPAMRGDVAHDRRHAEVVAAGIDHRRCRQHHLDPGAVLGEVLGVVLAHLRQLRGTQRRGDLRAPQEHRDRVPDRLRSRVAVERLCRTVPAGDGAVAGVPDDRVARRVDDRREPRLDASRELALGHVTDRDQGDPAARSVERREGDLGRELGAVAAPPRELAAGSHRPGHGVGEVAVAMRGMSVAQRLGHEQLDRSAEQLVADVAEERACLLVGQHDQAVLVYADDRVRRELEQLRERRPTLVDAPVGSSPHARPPTASRSSAECRGLWRAYG